MSDCINSKEEEEIAREIKECQERIRKSEERLKELRSICLHPTYTVRLWSWRPGDVGWGRICDVCQMWVGNCSEEELEPHKDEWPLKFPDMIVTHVFKD